MTRNILNMQNRVANLNITMSNRDVVLAAVADFFSAIVDDLLVGYGASQIIVGNDTISTPLNITVEAARIGEPGYIYATLGLNLLNLSLVLLEVARTRFWSRLRKFNYLDLKSAIVASSAGGPVLAVKVDQTHRLQGSCWSGDPADPILNNLRITLEKSEIVPGMVAIASTATDPSGYQLLQGTELKQRITSKSSQAGSNEYLSTPSHREGWGPDQES
jgi:hypothetical protein